MGTHDYLKKLRANNFSYGHYAYLPSDEELDRFHSGSVDFFFGEVPTNNVFSFSAKDIFNTYVYPTSMGSPLWQDFVAGNNARCITDLLWSGGLCIGKTVTSEFAVHEETAVVNPWDHERTVGTSSAGATLSVLLGDVDIALATQTAGSIGRPASYTGTLAFKPTYGLIPRTGVLKTCDPFDTIGFFVKDPGRIRGFCEMLFKVGPDHPCNRVQQQPLQTTQRRPRVGVLHSSDVSCDSSSMTRLQDFIDYLEKSGCEIIDVSEPLHFSNIHEKHQLIYSYSLAYYFAEELDSDGGVSKSFLDTVAAGKGVASDVFVKLLEEHQNDVGSSDKWMRDNQIDFVIAPTTHSGAPLRGGPEPNDFNLLLTYLHMPVAYLPVWFDQQRGLPLGVAIASSRFNDYSLIAFMEDIMKDHKPNEGYNFNGG